MPMILIGNICLQSFKTCYVTTMFDMQTNEFPDTMKIVVACEPCEQIHKQNTK